MTITLTLPLPDRRIHPNARTHWGTKRRLVASAKGMAKILACAAYRGPPLDRVTVHATFYVAKLNDGDNLNAWLKSTLDGLQGVVVKNDSGITLLPPAQVVDGKRSGKRGIELRIEEAA